MFKKIMDCFKKKYKYSKKVFCFFKNFNKFKKYYLIEKEYGEYNNLRSNFLKSFNIVVISMIIGIVLGKIIPKPYSYQLYNTLNKSIQYIGAGILLWSNLFNLDKKFNSWNGTRVSEKLEKNILNIFYILGTLFLFFSVSW